MRATAILTMLLAVGAAFAGGDGAANKKALKQLQGEWKMVRAETGGKPAPADKIEGAKLTVEGDQFLISAAGKDKKEAATVKLDVSKKPHAIDIYPPNNADKPVKGIFILEQDGQVLKVTFARRGGERPTEFVPQPGEPITVLEFRREKKQ